MLWDTITNDILQLVNNEFVVTNAELWQGTLVFLEVHTNKEINSNAIVANRTDCISQYNEEFLDKTNIEDLILLPRQVF